MPISRVSKFSNNNIYDGETVIMSTEDFPEDKKTTEADGTECYVVDESTHTTTGYYYAFNGYWTKH